MYSPKRKKPFRNNEPDTICPRTQDWAPSTENAYNNNHLYSYDSIERLIRVHQYPLKTGIQRSTTFEEKGLATHAVNCGVACGHACLYCSSKSMNRMHKAFKACGENPFEFGYAIVDANTPERIARDAKQIRTRGLIQLCTATDAWAPEAQEHQIGRRCLDAILTEPGWTVRILTKNASVMNDFEYLQQYRERVLVGLSITGTPDRNDTIRIVEKHASEIQERMFAMRTAAGMGLRTYAMFCPLLPGIANSPGQIDRLIRFAVECCVEEIFVEPVNARGPGLRLCQEALELWGYEDEALAVSQIRKRPSWSRYVVELLQNTQRAFRKYSDMARLRFLLYPKRLLDEDRAKIAADDQGVVWL